MTRLLVSVRDAAEAEVAVSAGADLVDIKEPLRGALGRADEATIGEITTQVAGRVPLSAALGELLDWNDDNSRAAYAGLDYIKFGLAGCRKLDDWQDRWRAAVSGWPLGIKPVAVAYADHEAADAPTPRDVLRLAKLVDAPVVLIDTFDKSLGGLLQSLPMREVTELIDEIRRAGRLAVVAGSLDFESIREVLNARPDVVAVRSAACGENRCGALDAQRVEQLASLTHGGESPRERLSSATARVQ